MDAVHVLDLAALLAHLRIELVAQDREEPGLEIGAGLERVLLVPRLHEGFLHEIVGAVEGARQRRREGTQVRDDGDEFFAKVGVLRHVAQFPSFDDFDLASAASRASSSDMKRSGTGSLATSS